MRALGCGGCGLVAAGLVSIAALGVWWWQSTRPRTLTVSIFPDYAYRQRPGWKALLESRMAEIARIYGPQTGVRWKLASIETEDAINGRSDRIDARRAELARNRTYPADVLLIVTGIHEGKRTGSVSPFSHAALVVDFPDGSELQNVRAMAQEMAHLFAAPNEQGTSTLMAPEPNDSRFPARAATLIRRLRFYDFRQGTAALEGSSDGLVLKALTEAGAGLNPNPLSHAHQVMAAALAMESRFQPAIRHLREAVKLEPNDPTVRMALALVLTQDTQSDAAIAVLREGVRAAPQSSRAHSMLASILARKDPEEAIDEYQAAIRLDPNSADLYLALGSLLMVEAGRADGAIAAFQAALRLNPQMQRAKDGLATAQAIQAQELAVAAKWSRQAEGARAGWSVYYNLGMAESRSAHFEAASRAFARAIQLNPQSGAPHSGMAMMHYIQGDYAAASAEIEKAKALGTAPPRDLLAAVQRKTAQR